MWNPFWTKGTKKVLMQFSNIQKQNIREKKGHGSPSVKGEGD